MNKKVTLQEAVERAIENAGGVRALAKAVDLSPGYISDLRNGNVAHPTIYVCRKLGIVPVKLRDISATICLLADEMETKLPNSAEKSAGLRKLLEAKDCFVRAAIE